MREMARPSPFGDRGRPGVRMVGVSRLVSGRADEQGITGRRPSWKIQLQGPGKGQGFGRHGSSVQLGSSCSWRGGDIPRRRSLVFQRSTPSAANC